MRESLQRVPLNMQEAFLILVAAELVFGLWSLWSGIQWFVMARRSQWRHRGFFAPRVALICPCKGVEPGLEDNLIALTDQDYPGYEVFFVLARQDDTAYATLKRVVDAGAAKAHIVIAGAPQACGEKVNNLRRAVEQLEPGFDVLVFVDSDGRPGHQWLGHIVAPLSDPKLGAATTFRWWLPARGGFWSAFGAAWDASIATMQGAHNRNFCWGGGTAIRREVFEQALVREHWAGAVSDDWTMTQALRNTGRAISFVPECLMPTLRDADFGTLLEFTNRQMIISRVYAPKIWWAGALTHLLYCGTIFLGLYLIVQAAWIGQIWLQTALLLLVVMILAAAKGVLRWLAVNELLPEWKYKLESYAWAWIFLAPLVPFLYLINFTVSFLRREIRWRGVRYKLVSAAQTKIL